MEKRIPRWEAGRDIDKAGEDVREWVLCEGEAEIRRECGRDGRDGGVRREERHWWVRGSRSGSPKIRIYIYIYIDSNRSKGFRRD